MKITISNKRLYSIADKTKGVADPKSTMDSLSNVLFDVGEDTVTVYGSDLNNTIAITTTDCDIQEGGKASINAERLYNITRRLQPDADVTIESADGHWVTVQAGTFSSKVPGLDPDDYPKVVFAEPEEYIQLKARTFHNMINKTAFCVSTDISHENLCGIHVKLENGRLELESTDGHRMAMIYHDEQEGEDLEAVDTFGDHTIVPIKAMEELGVTLKGFDGNIRIGKTEGRMTFVIGNTRMSSMLVTGKFPDFQNILPPFNDEEAVTVDTRDFRRVVDIVGIFADTESSRMNLEATEDDFKVFARSAEAGEGEEVIPLAAKGAEGTRTYNHKYLKDILKEIDGEQVSLLMNEGKRPTIIVDAEDDTYQYVVMPMH